jgi:hypothetical protein
MQITKLFIGTNNCQRTHKVIIIVIHVSQIRMTFLTSNMSLKVCVAVATAIP